MTRAMTRAVTRITAALALALTVALPIAAQDDDEPRAPAPIHGGAREVEQFMNAMLSQDRDEFRLGELEVVVSVVPDHFMLLIAREFLRVQAEGGRPAAQLRTQLQRLADRNKKSIGRVALRATFRHQQHGGGNFYAFQGGLDDHIGLRAAGNVPLTVSSHEGNLENIELTLFRASRSPVFSAEGQCPPVMRRQVVRLGPELKVELLAKRELSPRAKELQVGIGGFMHFSGGGIRGNQVDFDNGATAVVDPSPELKYPLPLTAQAVPAALAEVMPTIPD